MMEKDILTPEDIQYDLRYELRNHIISISVFLGLFFFLRWCFVFMAGENPPLLIVLPCAVILIGFFIVIIMLSIRIFWLCMALFRPHCVVMDRLGYKKIKAHYRRFYSDVSVSYYLYFAERGKYSIPANNYRWSSLYAMDCSEAYFQAECGDEFYLVLSKPNTGKILLAYSTKMFDYQPPQQ